MTPAEEEKALKECYRRLFKESTPEGDYDLLVENAKLDYLGRKTIPFLDYSIDEVKFNEIVEDVIKKYRIRPDYKAKLFRNSVLLGPSPKFS